MIGAAPIIGAVVAATLAAWAALGVFDRIARPPRRPPDGSPTWAGRHRRRDRTVWPRPMPRLVRRRAPSAGPAEFGTWVESIARLSRAGTSLRQAIVGADGPAGVMHATETLRRDLAGGLALDAAVDEWSTAESRRDDDHGQGRRRSTRCDDSVETIGVVLVTLAGVGGAIGEPLDRVAMALRQRAADLGERRAQSAQALMSARVLAALPIVVLLLLVTVDEGVRSVVASPAGGLVLVVGGVLDGLGFWWMQRIVGGGR